MYKDENDIRTPRDRIDEELARRLLELGSGSAADTDCTRVSAPRRDSRDCPQPRASCGNRGSSAACFSAECNRPVEPRRDNGRGGCGCRGGLGINNEGGPDVRCCNSRNNLHELVGFPLAMVYSPVQAWRCVYDINTALDRGTLFKELDKPLEAVETTGRCGGCKR